MQARGATAGAKSFRKLKRPKLAPNNSSNKMWQLHCNHRHTQAVLVEHQVALALPRSPHRALVLLVSLWAHLWAPHLRVALSQRVRFTRVTRRPSSLKVGGVVGHTRGRAGRGPPGRGCSSAPEARDVG